MSEIFSRISHEFFRSSEYRDIQKRGSAYSKSLAMFLLLCPNLNPYTGYGEILNEYFSLHWLNFSPDNLKKELQVLERLNFLKFDFAVCEYFVPLKVKQTLGYSFNPNDILYPVPNVLRELGKLPSRYFPFLIFSLGDYFGRHGIVLRDFLPPFETWTTE